jgi:hypothetical protein
MAAIDFPNSPTVGDQHIVGDKVWQWDGSVWDGVPNAIKALLDGGDPSSTYVAGGEINGGDPGSF